MREYLLSIDPGLNTGISYGWFDDVTGYVLVSRWQVHGGLDGFVDWYGSDGSRLMTEHDTFVVEKFILGSNSFVADTTPLLIEGYMRSLWWWNKINWQPRQAKGELIGYTKDQVTKDQRQRARFDFLDKFGLFAAGTENDDSNDAITHSLVYLKTNRRHVATIDKYWGE